MTMQAIWSPPYDFSAAKTTFIDVWPNAWRKLAPSYEIIPIDRIEINALGAQVMGFRHWFTPASTKPLIDLAHRLDTIIAQQNRTCFIRLISRSPKDSLYAMRNGMCIRNGTQALAIIIEGSERCAADLRMSLDSDHGMAIVVRNWLDFPPWAELRCFMLNRAWVGACQTQHLYPNINDHVPAVLKAFARAMAQIIEASPIANAAFDLVYQQSTTPGTPASAILLDANPLLDVTDTMLFSAIPDLDGTFRFRHPKDQSMRSVPLPAKTHF